MKNLVKESLHSVITMADIDKFYKENEDILLKQIRSKFQRVFKNADKSDIEELKSFYWYEIVDDAWEPAALYSMSKKIENDNNDIDVYNRFFDKLVELEAKVLSEMGISTDILY